MAVNFRNKISMQPMRSHIIEVRGFLIFLVGEGKGGFFPKLYLVWKVDYPLFTFHLDSGLSMQVFFFGF
jgi:hypothetical protein